MQQRTRRLAIIIGGGFLVTLAGVLAACSTDNGSTPTPGGGSDSGRDTGSKTDSGEEPDDDSGTPKDGGADCANAPKVQEAKGIYCFKDSGPDGSSSCTDDQICCSDAKDKPDGSFLPAFCVDRNGGSCNFPTGSVGGEEWHCLDRGQCEGEDYCCAIADPITMKKPEPPRSNTKFPGCSAYFNGADFVGGTRCKAACEPGESTLCGKDSDCKVGKCVPIDIGNRFTGYCRISAE